MPTLLIVDDNHAFRAWAGRMLADEGFEIVGEAVDGVTAIEAVSRLHPDVTLLDVVLPDMTGFEVADAVQDQTTVVLTSSRSAGDLRPDSRLADSFVTKSDLDGRALMTVMGRT